MDTHRIHEAALQQGIMPQALATVAAKVQAHFEGSTPSPAEVGAYIGTLPVWDKIGMAQETFLALPAAWRLDQARRFAPPPAPRRPVTRSLTTEELAALQQEGLTGAAYTERARQMQQTPAP